MLNGNELIFVLPVTSGGLAAATTEAVTTQDIADLGGGGGGGGTGQTITNSYSFSITPSIFTTNIANITPGAVAISVDPTALTPWAMYIVQDAGGNAGANNITITPTSGTFQLQTNYVIFQDTGGVKFYSDGTNIWASP